MKAVSRSKAYKMNDEDVLNSVEQKNFFDGHKRSRGPNRESMELAHTTAREQLSLKGLFCLLAAAVVTLTASIYSMQEAQANAREQEVGAYISDEKAWNTTYLPDLQNVHISIIKDIQLFNQTHDEISEKVQQIVGLNDKLVNHQDPKGVQNIKQQIQDAHERLKTLRARWEHLKTPMASEVKEEDARRLNHHDRYGNLPGYQPYQFTKKEYTMDQTWVVDESLKVDANGNFGGVVAKDTPTIQDSKEFEQIYYEKSKAYKANVQRRNMTVWLELTQKDNGARQVLNIPDVQLYQVRKRRMSEKKSQRVNHCVGQHGYLGNGEYCTKYYQAFEVCIAIAKDQDTGKWYLDSNRYGQNTFGCGFQSREFRSSIQYDRAINSVHVWKQMPKAAQEKSFDYLFPLKPAQCEFQIRHGGDPLLAALNLSTARNHLDFGQSSSSLMYLGYVGLIVASVLFFVIFHQCVYRAKANALRTCLQECLGNGTRKTNYQTGRPKPYVTHDLSDEELQFQNLANSDQI